MQRQSLGSPNSKLHIHGGGSGGGGGGGVLSISSPKPDPHIIITEPDSKRKDALSSSSSSSSSLTDDYDDQHKSLKPRRLSLSHSSPSKPENIIHLIPLLTFFCFLILYLSSHNPSPSDLAQFNGFKRPSNHIDSTEIARFVELKRGDVLAIRSLKNLQEIRKHAPKSRSHRKFADF